jgi:cell division protein FtsL
VKRPRAFLVLWTLAVAAAVSAFSVHLALRGRAFELGYQLGQSHSTLAGLRESKRVLELELAAYKTPERVGIVARSLLGMSEPSPDRLLHAGAIPRTLTDTPGEPTAILPETGGVTP